MLQVRISIVRETKSPPSPDESPPTSRSSWRRVAALGSILALVGVALGAGAGAAPTTDTSAVDFVSMPAKQVWGGNSISPNITESVIVIGGATTVPTNATTVRLDVTVTGTAAGTIKLFPAGNPSGGPGHTVSWNAGQVVTVTTNEHPGQSNKLSVQNLSTKAARVTVKITGYSTQVTAGDINGSGGTAGQVLTNNGAGGATWKAPSNAYRSGGGASFTGGFATVSQVTVPAGAYAVHFAGEFANNAGTVHTAQCQLLSPAGQIMGQTRGTAPVAQSESIALVGLGRTTGGNYRVQCRSVDALLGAIFDPSLVAVQVGTANGVVNTAKPAARQSSPQR